MFARDVEMFIEYCENKGLATKTIGSYEQTLRLLMLWLDEQGITQTEKITHGVPIAVILQYGHGTRNGGYVQGTDYINPAMKPIFDKIAQRAWEEVKRG